MPDDEELGRHPVVERRGSRKPKTSIHLNQLFLSLQDQLLAKMETSRTFVHHSPTKGAAAEQAWLAMLQAYLPQRYKADSAFVVDSNGKLSEQIDIVIYDRQYSPLILHQEGVLYVPAESVYAVFDVKHELRRTAILESAKKAESVRKLKRTSVAIRHAGGTYKAKRPIEITAGILTLESWWSGGRLAESVDKVLGELPKKKFIDLGCAIRGGAFEASRFGKKLRVEKSTRETALIFFFLRLLHRLQHVGTVPAIDILKYASGLMIRDEES
jgi:hypothetical protein